jgi:uncharacterized protein YndB with AHSA1/START domain
MERTSITVKTVINASVQMVWFRWTNPDDILHWNNASEDWHTTKAVNELHIGGKFSYRMEARDGSIGFDFDGVYDKVLLHKEIAYTLGDDRKVKIVFNSLGNQTEVVQTFEAEDTNPVELQQTGWQAIMDNFKRYVERPHL